MFLIKYIKLGGLNMKLMHIVYIGAVLFGVIACIQVPYVNSGFSSLLILILSYLGIWLYNKNKLISMVQFIVCGFLFYFLVCGNLGYFVLNYQIFSIITSILFIILAIIIYSEYHENNKLTEENIEIKKTKKYWIIPIMTFIVIFIIFSAIPHIIEGINYPNTYSYSSNYDTTSKINIHITDHDYRSSGMLSGGTLYGSLSSNTTHQGINLKTKWYDENGFLLDSDYDYDLSTTRISPNEEYTFQLYYSTDGSKATEVEIDIYDESTGKYLDTQKFNI